jgi:hypothetical protein
MVFEPCIFQFPATSILLIVIILKLVSRPVGAQAYPHTTFVASPKLTGMMRYMTSKTNDAGQFFDSKNFLAGSRAYFFRETLRL